MHDGYLRPGKDVEHQHILSQDDLEYIYGSINFGDLNNIDVLENVSLLLHPQLVYDYGIIFNKGWFAHPYESSIYVHASDYQYHQN